MSIMNRVSAGRYVVALFLFSILINITANCFSPLYTMESNLDPVAFYMEGRAWAHGYLPYRDFTDVKGIFLFFIYYIGYILSPDQTWGILSIYILSTFFFGVIAYKIAQLLKLTDFQAFAAVMLCMFVRFYASTSYWAAQPEWLIDTFLIWSLYTFMRMLESTKTINRKLIVGAAFSAGVVAGVCFLIKYNYTLIVAVTAMLSMWLMYRNKCAKSAYMLYVLTAALSFTAFVLPFIVYMLSKGIWHDFVYDYFTLNVISNAAGAPDKPTGWFILIRMRNMLAEQIGLAALIGMCYFVIKALNNVNIKKPDNKHFCLLILAGSYFFNCVAGKYGYYYLCFVPMMIIPLSEAAKKLLTGSYTRWCKMLLGIFLMACVVMGNSFYSNERGLARKKEHREKLNLIDRELARIHKPKIIYYDLPDAGLGRKACVLPACAEWCEFPGLPKELYAKRDAAILNKEADYIFACDGKEFLSSAGYELIKGVSYEGIHMWRPIKKEQKK